MNGFWIFASAFLIVGAIDEWFGEWIELQKEIHHLPNSPGFFSKLYFRFFGRNKK